MNKLTAFIKQGVSCIVYSVEKSVGSNNFWQSLNNYTFNVVFQAIKIPVLIADEKNLKIYKETFGHRHNQ